jgi:hypothetical protein
MFLSDGTEAKVGHRVCKLPVSGDDMVGVIRKLYAKGTDSDGIPHSYDDSLVEWPNGVTCYEYLKHLVAITAER